MTDLAPSTKTLHANFPLRSARAHEVCGSGASVLASISCGVSGGQALWISPTHQQEHLHPEGVTQFCEPYKFVYASGKTQTDVLWMAEEALRSDAVKVVVAQLSKPIDLTAGRRLQLAAEGGKTLGVFLIPEGMGSNAAETRWRCSPHFDAKDSTLHRWQLIKNKSGTLGGWIVRWDEQARRVIVVSKVIE
ncbi:MAG: hypothetical protein AAED33_11110 [Paracoccaceae bacterium]|jgi:protein ImuA